MASAERAWQVIWSALHDDGKICPGNLIELEGACGHRAIRPDAEENSPGMTGRSASVQANPYITACSKR
jgi:hypothetical protein